MNPLRENRFIKVTEIEIKNHRFSSQIKREKLQWFNIFSHHLHGTRSPCRNAMENLNSIENLTTIKHKC